MAIFYMNWSLVQHSKGQNAVAAAAYRHGQKMACDITGMAYDYSDRRDVTHSEITLPEDAPDWMVETYGAKALGVLLDGREATQAIHRAALAELSGRLWNDAEAFEEAHNKHAARARVAGKITFALPVELSDAEQLELARAFVRNSLSGRGALTDWVRHEPEPNAQGEVNPHIHAMVTLREFGAEGWGLKNRSWDHMSLLRSLRAEWAREANIALERAGRPERIDPRKLVDQGIELEPTGHDRTLALALEDRGEVLRRKVRAGAALEANRAYLRSAPDHILAVVTSERTVFTQDDVEKAFLRQGFENPAAALLTRQAMASVEVVALADEAGEPRYMTRAQLDVESRTMGQAAELAGRRLSVPEEDGMAVPAGLDDGQRAAFGEMVSPGCLSLVSGYAGTGKTHVIAQAAEVWRARGFEVLGGAISGRATQGLSEVGMRALSLAAWEARWSRGMRPEAGRFVFFLDEAGMVGTATWARVQAQVAQMGGKLIAVGDPEQLQPVLDTGIFGRLTGRFGAAVIDSVRRMRDAGDRKATQDFGRGKEGALAALRYYRKKGAIRAEPTKEEAIESLVKAYYAEPAELAAPAKRANTGSAAHPLADQIESGTGPVVIALPEEAAPEETHETNAAANAATSTPKRAAPPTHQPRGPSKEAVREALLARAGDLFRAAFGEPQVAQGAEWRAKASAAVSMQMRGPNKGLWFDHRSGEGGDLMDLVAHVFCGLSRAQSDFPRVLEEAARFTGLAAGHAALQDLPAVQARAAMRAREDAEHVKREARRRAEVLGRVRDQAQPVSGSPAATYLAGRGITAVPQDAVGWVPPVPGVAVRSPELGALVVWARDHTGQITGGQRILVNGDGRPAQRTVRKPAFGSIGGSFARFAATGDQGQGLLVIAEGPESALSIWQATGYETWAVFGASNWKNVPVPTDRPVILAPDRDAPDSPAGRAFRKALAHHLKRGCDRSAGCDLSIATAPEPVGSKRDLNDTDRRAGPDAVRAALDAARPVCTPEMQAPTPVEPSTPMEASTAVTTSPEVSRVAIGYSGVDVDALNAALRDAAISTGRVDEDAQINYGVIKRLDRRGPVPKRYTVPMLLAPGDRVVFTKPHRALGISKSSFATVTRAQPDRIGLELDGGREVEIDMSAFDHFDYGYAATAHRLQGVTVDRAFALAHPRMSRSVAYVMMSRHRDSAAMFVPEDRFANDTFEAVASRDDVLEAGRDGTETASVAGTTFAETPEGQRRVDAVPVGGDAAPITGVSFLRDPHLLSVMRRTAGLLASDRADGDPVLGEDTQGYVADPTRVIDDLVARRSVIRAQDVAETLSRVALHPDTFVRLFREAMAHPDLVALTVGEASGTGRVYSTGQQVVRELGVLDLGVALGLAHAGPDAPAEPEGAVSLSAAAREAALTRAGLDDTGRNAARHAAGAGQLRMITGAAGTGKTRVLGALSEAHEASGFTVYRVAPTRNATRAFADCGVGSVKTLTGFLRELETGDIRLDAHTVILLDEAGLAGLEQTRDLFEVMEVSGSKLIAAWDPAQVGAPSPSRLFDDLDARLGSARLGASYRQKTSEARAALAALKPDVSARAGASQLLEAGHVERAGNPEDAIKTLVDGYLADTSPDRIIVTATRREAAEVNRVIVERLRAGATPSGEVVMASDLEEGDRVRLSEWYAPARLGAGTRAVVVRADRQEVRLRLDVAGAARHVVVRRDDREFRCGMAFAQTVYEAKGQGHASVHVLVRPAWSRETLVTAAGLHGERLRVVVPADDGEQGREMLSGILSRETRADSVAGHVLDPALGAQAAREGIESLRRHARGAGSPWAPAGETAVEVGEAELIADPARILSVLASRRARFSLSDVRRAMAARVTGENIDDLVGRAMDSGDIVWLKETGADGAQLFTTRANENAAYLLGHPEHILTLMTAERTVFTLEDLDAAFARRLPSQEAAGLLEKVTAQDALVALEAWGPEGHQLFTTRAQIATEQALVAQARKMAGEVRTQADPVRPLPDHITGAQRKAGEAMLGDAGLVLVRGVAGSGKTTVLREVAARWRERGFDVCGGALGARAAGELGDGVPEMLTLSLAAWEARWARGWRPSGKGFVFVMDEAAMVGSDVWARVQARVAQMGGKLIAVGDPAQLQPVSASNAWMAVEAEVGSVVIDRVRRQKSAEHRKWTEMFATGQGAQAVRGYADAGCVRFEDSLEMAIQRVAQGYYATGTQGETRIALAYTKADVAALNAAIRAEALTRGHVDAATERSYAQAPERTFGVGDRVRFAEPNREQGIARNSFGRVTRTDAAGIEVELDGSSRKVALAAEEIAALDYGYAATVHSSQGITVDRAVTLAHGFMDRHTLYVAMSRHVKDADLIVPRTRIEGIAALEAQAMRSSARPLAAQVAEDRSRATPGASATDPADRPGTGFEDDAYLAGVLARITGLLRVTPDPNAGSDPGTDPGGYARAPHLVIDALISERATFGAEDVARRLMPVTRDADSFARLFREAMSHPDLIRLTEGDGESAGRLYTTRTQFDLELRVMDRAVALAMGPRAEPLDSRFFGAIVKERGLSKEQAKALSLTASGNRLTLIGGGSGSGKTWLAGVLADLHGRQDREVIAVSPTGRGVDNLRTEGAVRAMTLKGLEQAVASGGITLHARSVILLDEASLVGAKTADRLLEMVETSGAKLIAFTDTDQIDSYEAGPVFRTLEARLGGVDLGLGQRQQDEALARGVAQLGHHPSADHALKVFGERGVFKAGQSRGRAIDRLAADYVNDPVQDKIVLAHSREDVKRINTAIRAKLDLYHLERETGAKGAAGSVADLRPGDRIRLTRRYDPARLRAGTEAVVERRTRRGVVLRIGTQGEARYLKLKSGERDLRYDFAFASTIHGAKGRGTASVHMLASPGMTRRLLYTGAALCRTDLNIVVPTSKEQMMPALEAITRRQDSARAALDYGFDASARAREVLRARRGPDRPAPGALMDGLDRTLGWVADRLDGGINGGRAPAPTTRRRAALRGDVMVELMAACPEGARFGADEQQALEGRLDTLITGRGYKRFLGEGWGLRAFEAETEQGRIPGVARAEQMTRRVLGRGVEMAEATGEDALRDWFARAEASVTAEIEAQQAAHRKVPSRPPAVPGAEQGADPGVEGDRIDARHRDYRGMALQLAQAISARIPRSDPVHDLDQIGTLEEMLRRADPGAARPVGEAEVFRRVQHVSWTRAETHSLAKAAVRAMAEGPLEDRRTLYAEREAVFRHLERPEDPVDKAADLVPRLRVFTHNEAFALYEPEAPWPDSLPKRGAAERAVISKRLQAYGDEFEKETEMEKETSVAAVRDTALKKLALGRIDADTLDSIPDVFDLKEIAALRNPDQELPASLPAMDPATRRVIAETLMKATQDDPAETDSAGQVAGAPEPLEAPPHSPQEARVRDMALSLGSAVSQHIRPHDAVHSLDLQERIEDLLTAAPQTPVRGQDPNQIAQKIARERLANEIRREAMKTLDREHWTDEVLYGRKNSAFLGAYRPKENIFDQLVETGLKEREPPAPTEYDRAIADILCRENADETLARTIGKALEYSVPPSATDIRDAREMHMEALRTGGALGDTADQHVKALFAAFSHRDVEGLLKSGTAPDLPEQDPGARKKIAYNLVGLFAAVEKAGKAPGIVQARSLCKTYAPKVDLDQGRGQGPSQGPGW